MTPKISFITVATIGRARLRRSRLRRRLGHRPESGDYPRLAGFHRSRRRREAAGTVEHARRPRTVAHSEERGNENLGARSDSRQSLPADPAAIPTPAATVDSAPADGLAADRDRVRRRHPARDCPLPGDAGDPGPPTRALIDSHLALDAVRAETPTAEATRRPVDPPAGVLQFEKNPPSGSPGSKHSRRGGPGRERAPLTFSRAPARTRGRARTDRVLSPLDLLMGSGPVVRGAGRSTGRLRTYRAVVLDRSTEI